MEIRVLGAVTGDEKYETLVLLQAEFSRTFHVSYDNITDQFVFRAKVNFSTNQKAVADATVKAYTHGLLTGLRRHK